MIIGFVSFNNYYYCTVLLHNTVPGCRTKCTNNRSPRSLCRIGVTIYNKHVDDANFTTVPRLFSSTVVHFLVFCSITVAAGLL